MEVFLFNKKTLTLPVNWSTPLLFQTHCMDLFGCICSSDSLLFHLIKVCVTSDDVVVVALKCHLPVL